MAKSVYVGNLSYDVEEEKLRGLFGQYGSVESVNIITDRDTGRSKGFAFVEFGTDEEMKAAIAGLDGKEIEGRQLKVNEARERKDTRSPKRTGGFSRNRF